MTEASHRFELELVKDSYAMLDQIGFPRSDQPEMVHVILDYIGVPRTDGDRKLSLAERVSRFANPLDANTRRTNRNQSILRDRLAGLTYKALEEKYGLTRERCRQIVKDMGHSRTVVPVHAKPES